MYKPTAYYDPQNLVQKGQYQVQADPTFSFKLKVNIAVFSVSWVFKLIK